MNIVHYISNLAIPFLLFMIVGCGFIEKKNVFDFFVKGAKDGVRIVCRIFPTLIGLFVAIGLLRSSGILDFIIRQLNSTIGFLGIPKEIMPLAILRPISRKCINCSGK